MLCSESLSGEYVVMDISISTRRVVAILFSVTIALTSASLALNFVRLYTGRETIMGLMNLFELDNESNLPAIFSFCLMAFSFLLLCMITAHSRRCGQSYLQWFWLALVFGYLALDEGAMIHEMAQEWIRPFIPRVDALIHVWVVPYGLLFIIVALAFLRFWLRLEPVVRLAMAAAGVTYVCGAIGFEMLGALNYAKYGDNRGLEYTLLSNTEEFLEMTGVVIFIYALLKYIQLHSIAVTVSCRRPHVSGLSDPPEEDA